MLIVFFLFSLKIKIITLVEEIQMPIHKEIKQEDNILHILKNNR